MNVSESAKMTVQAELAEPVSVPVPEPHAIEPQLPSPITQKKAAIKVKNNYNFNSYFFRKFSNFHKKV